MKRLNISIVLSVSFLIMLLFLGCAKVQQPKLEDAEAYLNRGVAYGHKGQYDKAISEFTKAIEINPRDAEAYYNRGLSYSI